MSKSIKNDIEVKTLLLERFYFLCLEFCVVNLEVFERTDVLDGREALDVGVVHVEVLQFCEVLEWF